MKRPMPSAWRIRGRRRWPDNTAEGNSLKLLLAWGFVGIPLAWGVIETIINAMKLFQ